MNVDALEAMLNKGMDTPLLRFGLGKAYLDQQDTALAIEHLQQCVTQDPHYSAAWQILGQAYLDSGDIALASQAWEKGISVAQAKGDKQAEKIMQVFLRRVEKLRKTE
ncbi:tetratricopeptide repeat protein [Alcaligenaceae bacterium 429]|uniref:tetratricopeptide repeat protein n=1 Tax=Paenalcaligenes sp. Me52 TaxID=3392038 RepID=UPI001091C15F|nr:tetratricopeptide repeat protein [Alcaligenaceae bacterium 429]